MGSAWHQNPRPSLPQGKGWTLCQAINGKMVRTDRNGILDPNKPDLKSKALGRSEPLPSCELKLGHLPPGPSGPFHTGGGLLVGGMNT